MVFRSSVRRLASVVVLAVLSVVLGAPRASAATEVETLPFEAVVEACGQTISLSGRLRVIATVQNLGSRGLRIAVHFQPQGVRGSSESGADYRATGVTRDSAVFTPSGGATLHLVNRFHLVGTAGAPTYVVKETVHFTVTPAGEVTASVGRLSITCR